MSKVWTYGISNFDVIAQPVGHWPKPGELVVTDRTEFMPGGPAINTAITLRKIGFPQVGLIARFGKDRAGSILSQELEKMGVDTQSVSTSDSSPTAVCIVCVHPGGERSFLYSFGGNNELSPENADISRVAAGDVFHLGAAMGMARSRAEFLIPLLETLKAKPVTITVDTSFDPAGAWWPSLAPCLPFTDVLFSNESEAQYLTGHNDPQKAAVHFQNAGAKTVVIKLGGEGCFVLSPSWQGKVAPFTVDAVDTTGAGDAYCGGFLFGMQQGWPVEQTALFANAVGALCVLSFGATEGIQSYEKTVEFVRSQGRAGSWNWNIS
jgi:sugar/nucleoside kinase (ribokinase family)